MIQFGGWYLPSHEKHLQGWMTKVNRKVNGRLSYQYHKLEVALEQCKQHRVAVDVGAHCGLMSFHLANHFDEVVAFEPVSAHRECFVLNVQAKNVRLHGAALGEEPGNINIRTTQASSGDSWIDGPGDIPLRRLDDYGFDHVDFIKLDCEGSELPALKGSIETLKRCHPCIMVEQKPGHAQRFGLGEIEAVTWLEAIGYKIAKVMSGDYIMVHV